MHHGLRLALLSLLLTAGLRAAPQHWGQLKLGLPAPAAAALLGEPLVRTSGHGFETWTYDRGAEVLLCATGQVVGWTAPAAATGNDIWRSYPAGEYYATMHAILPRPVKRTAPGALPTPAPAADEGVGYERYIRG